MAGLELYHQTLLYQYISEMVYCTSNGTSTLLGYKLGATLYRLVGEAHLDKYLLREP